MAKVKILIVEDQYIEASNLELILKRAGYAVCEIARSVAAALHILLRPVVVVHHILLQEEDHIHPRSSTKYDD